jgi:hypothetical protein
LSVAVLGLVACANQSQKSTGRKNVEMIPIEGNMPINIIRRNRASEGSAALKHQCPMKDTALVIDGETPHAKRSRPNTALAMAKHPQNKTTRSNKSRLEPIESMNE